MFYKDLLDREVIWKETFVRMLKSYHSNLVSETPLMNKIWRTKVEKGGSKSDWKLYPQLLKEILKDSSFVSFTKEDVDKHNLIIKMQEIVKVLT